MRTLIIHLPADPMGSAPWALFTADGAKLREGALVPEAVLPDDVSADRTWALVPGVSVTAHNVELPADVRERHALAGAAFALEDSLAVETDDLHFALAQPTGPQRLVTVTDHTHMSAWTARLLHHGLKVDLMVPDYLAIPEGAAANGGFVLVRTAESGFAIEGDLAAWMPVPAEIVTVAASALLVRAHEVLSQGAPLTLLQGRYAPRRDWVPLLRPWKRAGALVAGIVLAGLISLAVEGMRLQSQAEAATAQAETVFRAALPEVKRVVNPRAQMRAHLQNAKLSTSGGFLAVSDVIVGTIAAVDGAELMALRFDGKRGEASATLSLPSFEAVERMKTEMIRKGAAVQEGGARQDGPRIVTDMTVRMP